VECAYVKSDAVLAVDYFSTPLLLGVSGANFMETSEYSILLFSQKNGVEKILGTGPLSDFEKELLEKALPELRKNIETGIKFIRK